MVHFFGLGVAVFMCINGIFAQEVGSGSGGSGVPPTIGSSEMAVEVCYEQDATCQITAKISATEEDFDYRIGPSAETCQAAQTDDDKYTFQLNPSSKESIQVVSPCSGASTTGDTLTGEKAPAIDRDCRLYKGQICTNPQQ